jgi:hypothetical protein
MPKKIDPKVEGIVFGLSESVLGQRSIVRYLKGQIIKFSLSAVHNIVKNIGKQRVVKSKGLPSPVKNNLPTFLRKW